MKKVLIVGGGIAGLTAGIYAVQCGFEAIILEMHSIAGGNCTSWKRGEYLFEGGMHWLTGSGSRQPLNKVWRNVGALDASVSIKAPETFAEYDHNGELIKLYRSADKLEAHLKALSPQDSKQITSLCKDIRRFGNFAMPVSDIKGLKVTRKSTPPLSMLFTLLRSMPRMVALSKLSIDEYASKFTHEGIRAALCQPMPKEYYANALIMTLAGMNAGDCGLPEGGSLPFALRMAKRFESLGGKILYNTHAERVIVENSRAVGVSVKGERISADAVIVTLDTMAAQTLFDAPLNAAWLDDMQKTVLPNMNVFVALGINADLADLPHAYAWKPSRPLELAGMKYEFLQVYNYSGVETYCPKGKAALTLPLAGDTYDFWKQAKQAGRYAEEKAKIADAIVSAVTEKIPRAAGNVGVVDVATPLTYERYCANWRGSWMTIVPKNSKMKSYPCQIDSLGACYFAGQRLMPPGGLPVALATGRTAVQHLCRDTGTVFVSEEE